MYSIPNQKMDKNQTTFKHDLTTISIESVIKQQPLKKKIFRIVLSLSLSVFYHHLYYLINPGVMYKSRINLKDKVK